MLAETRTAFGCRHSSYTRRNQAQTLTSTHDPRMHSLDSLGLQPDNACLDFGAHGRQEANLMPRFTCAGMHSEL